MSESVVCRHVWVSGRVQGVWFRARTAEQARALGLQGWVRNRADGRVEVLIQGSESTVERLLAWLEQGPPLARVDRLSVNEVAVVEGLEPEFAVLR